MTDTHDCLQRPWPIEALPIPEDLLQRLTAAGHTAVRAPLVEAMTRFLAGGSPLLASPAPETTLPWVMAAAALCGGAAVVYVTSDLRDEALRLAAIAPAARVRTLSGAEARLITLRAEGTAGVWTVRAERADADAMIDLPATVWRLDVPPGLHRLRALRVLFDTTGDEGWICVAADPGEVANFLQRQGILAVPGHPAWGAGRSTWERGEHDVLVVSADAPPAGAPSCARVVFVHPTDAAHLAAWRAACRPDTPFVLVVDLRDPAPPEPCAPLALPDPASPARTARQLARLRSHAPPLAPEAWLETARALAADEDGLVLLAHGLACFDRAQRQEDLAWPGRPAEEGRRKRKRRKKKGRFDDPTEEYDDDPLDDARA